MGASSHFTAPCPSNLDLGSRCLFCNTTNGRKHLNTITPSYAFNLESWGADSSICSLSSLLSLCRSQHFFCLLPLSPLISIRYHCHSARAFSLSLLVYVLSAHLQLSLCGEKPEHTSAVIFGAHQFIKPLLLLLRDPARGRGTHQAAATLCTVTERSGIAAPTSKPSKTPIAAPTSNLEAQQDSDRSAYLKAQ